MNKEKGLVIVYTGLGKGKTTAALGLALRALGYGKRVLIVQFGKTKFSGELKSLKLFNHNVKVIQGGKGFVQILGDKIPLSEHKKAAEETMEELYREIKSNKWDLVIADEIIGALAGKLLTEDNLLKLICDKPKSLDLVFTGRHASQKLIEQADMVTEMRSIKHPFDQGVLARESIDY